MPHLSPMNWLLAIISIWFLLFTMISLMWWNPKTLWPVTKSYKSSSVPFSWKWA